MFRRNTWPSKYFLYLIWKYPTYANYTLSRDQHEHFILHTKVKYKEGQLYLLKSSSNTSSNDYAMTTTDI